MNNLEYSLLKNQFDKVHLDLKKCRKLISDAIVSCNSAVLFDGVRYKKRDLERLNDKIKSQINMIEDYYLPEIKSKIGAAR